MDDLPPSYMSQDNQTSTVVDRRGPPLSPPLKPHHSTRASGLSHDASQGRCSVLEYYELTFPLLISYNDVRKPIVVAVDEQFDVLLKDIERLFGIKFETLTRRVKELRVSFSNVNFGGGKGDVLNETNITAMLRLLKARNGADTIFIK